MTMNLGIIASGPNNQTWHTAFPWTYSWLADDLPDGLVAEWVSGTGAASLSQSIPGSQPIRSVEAGCNSQPGVAFDGTTDFLQTVALGTFPQPNTIVLIARLISINSTQANAIADGIGSANRVQFAVTTASKFRINAGTNVDSVMNASLADNAWTCVFNAGSSVMERNGSNLISGNPGTQTIEGLTVGSRYDGTTVFANMAVSAVGWFAGGDARSNAAWDSTLAPYASSKWGLAL